MKARLPLVVILGGSLTFLASLYLAWDTEVNAATLNGLFRGTDNSGALALLNLFSHEAIAGEYSGWVAASGGRRHCARWLFAPTPRRR